MFIEFNVVIVQIVAAQYERRCPYEEDDQKARFFS